jgi:hemolysin activation/secretion protein
VFLTMTVRGLLAGAALTMSMVATPVLAAGQAASRPRTGPEAAPPPLPPFARPEAPPRPDTQPAPPPTVDGGALPVSDVRIAVDGNTADAVPPRSWQPPQDPDLRLDHRRGQRLDAAWARQQFERNGLIGNPVGVDRALALVQLINRAYLTAGFVNSGLVVSPDDLPTDPVLDLKLVAGRLTGPATVTWGEGGGNGLSESYVRSRIPSAGGQPLSAIAIERDFRLLAEDPAIRTVNADLRPGSRPGEASLNLTVIPQERFDLYLSAANSRSPSVGGERLALGGFFRHLLTGGDVLSGEYGETDGLSDATLSYVTPFLSPRTTLSIRGSRNNAAVIDRPLLPLDITSRDRAAEIGLTQKLYETPLLPSAAAGRWTPARSLSAGLLLAYRESKTFLFGEPFSFSPGSVNGRSEYYALRLVGDYVQRNVSEVIALSLTGTIGLDGTRSDIEGVPSPSRNFLALLAQFNYARRLTDTGLEFRGRLTGQYSDGTLYSGERLSAGGDETVRGYRENLILADRGVIGSAELSHPLRLGAAPAPGSGFDWGAFSIAGFFRRRVPAECGRARSYAELHPEHRRLAGLEPIGSAAGQSVVRRSATRPSPDRQPRPAGPRHPFPRDLLPAPAVPEVS